MIKRWSTFNENTNISKEVISSKFLEVREVFLEFEDMGIISYSLVSPGFERGGYISFDPKRGDVNRFLDFQFNSFYFENGKIYTFLKIIEYCCFIREFSITSLKIKIFNFHQ